jgi:glutathione gamma-glutamylcysteinyltransferase
LLTTVNPALLAHLRRPQGKRIFRAALDDGSVEGFFPLVQHFQTQSEPASCALGTLCMARLARGWRERRLR